VWGKLTSSQGLYYCTPANTWVGPFAAAGPGTGDVVGPASATDNAVARFDSTTGKLIQNSTAILSDAGAFAAGNGSASLPTYSFASDTSTGLYLSSGNPGFSSSGALRYTFGTSTLSVASTSGAVTFGGDVGVARLAAGVARVTNASTGAGSLIIGTSAGAIGTSGAGVLAFTASTIPSTSPADTVQFYSGDSAAGNHNLYSRNEAGEVNRITGLAARNSAQFDKTADTTLANVTGLTRDVEAARAYAFRAVIQTTAPMTGGLKLAVSGTATMTAISYEGHLRMTTGIIATTRATALDTVVCASTTTTTGTCVIEGVMVVNVGGTLTIQFAQNASDASASSVLANQYFQLIPIS